MDIKEFKVFKGDKELSAEEHSYGEKLKLFRDTLKDNPFGKGLLGKNIPVAPFLSL